MIHSTRRRRHAGAGQAPRKGVSGRPHHFPTGLPRVSRPRRVHVFPRNLHDRPLRLSRSHSNDPRRRRQRNSLGAQADRAGAVAAGSASPRITHVAPMVRPSLLPGVARRSTCAQPIPRASGQLRQCSGDARVMLRRCSGVPHAGPSVGFQAKTSDLCPTLRRSSEPDHLGSSEVTQSRNGSRKLDWEQD